MSHGWPPWWWPFRPRPVPAPPAPRPRPAPPVPVPTPRPGPPGISVEDELLALHNQFRQANGVRPLVNNPLLAVSAKVAAVDCAIHENLSHTSSDGKTPFQRISDTGYAWIWAGEDISRGQPDPASVCAAWESDLSHRQNMLNPHFRDVGFAMVQDVGGVPYWTADFGATMITYGAAGLEAFEDYPHPACAVAFRPPPDMEVTHARRQSSG